MLGTVEAADATVLTGPGTHGFAHPPNSWARARQEPEPAGAPRWRAAITDRRVSLDTALAAVHSPSAPRP